MAVADDVPPPPTELSPKALFNSGTNGAAPSHQTPSQGGTAAVQYQPMQGYYYSSAASSGGGSFPFAGFVLGASLPIDGTVDDLFNAGSLFELEIGQQWRVAHQFPYLSNVDNGTPAGKNTARWALEQDFCLTSGRARRVHGVVLTGASA